jgi:hypothetical protein
VISDEDFVAYLVRLAIVWPSIEDLRPIFPRWRSFLAERSVVSLNPAQAKNDARTNDLMRLLINQASSVSDSATKHRLRNTTGVRRSKP